MDIHLKDILLIVFYLVVPALVIHYAGHFLLIRKAGNVVVVYIIGLILGNIGILDSSSIPIQENLTNITILLSLPLLLVSLNFSSWTRMAPKSFISLGLGLISIITVVLLGYYLFKPIINDAWKMAGLLVGVYTGGTPNLASIKEALDVPSHEYLMVHTSDLIYSGAYLLFLMTIGKVIFKKWLPYGYLNNSSFIKPGVDFTNSEDYTNFFKTYNIIPTMGMLLVSILIFAISFGLSMLFAKEYQVMIIILSITTIGIGSSFIPTLRRTPKTYELGMYLILVFSLVVASMADMEKFSMEAIPIFLYVSFTITLSLLLHILLSKIFKIDADTTIITSTALICSPPFVPVIAGALNNRSLIISGLTIGIVGYAIGNYLGIFTALLLKP
ncbi:MAG: hypothetical protein DRI86_00145 [Bacteroidetes bacterium]|nr:MAG: hypothetical protein DRI86_00145 [Bacteroidota bacterium]